MAVKRGAPQNLRPQNTRTKEEQRRIAKAGGVASGKARREKKLMSAILADYLARQKGYDSFDKYIEKVLKRGDGSTVSMIKTFVESIEGQKIKSEVSLNVNPDDKAVAAVLEKYGVSKSTKSED